MSQAYVLPRSRPESVGVSPSAVMDFLEAADSTQMGLHSFMLLRHGQVAAEASWAPYKAEHKHMMFSLSKSFTSTAIGLAVAEGYLTLDDTVISFFPDKKLQVSGHLNKLRVRHLLSMSTGHEHDTMKLLWDSPDKDWVQAFLNIPIVYEPGTHFVYNSGASYMLSAIVQKVTGQRLLDYLQPRLLQPLGIEGATWEACPKGINTGGWGLSITVEHIALFGQLYLQKGVWNGTRLLSEVWVEEATSLQVQNGVDEESDWKQGYGFQFWMCRHGAYRGDGAFGQFCIVIPEQDVVIAMTSGVKKLQPVLDLVWTHLLPGFSNQPTSLNDEAYESLQQMSRSLAYKPLSSAVPVTLTAEVSGKRFVFEPNELNFKTAMFEFAENECVATYWNQKGEDQVRCGINYWIEGRTNITRPAAHVAASGRWLSTDTFEMEWRYVTTPFIDRVTCRFDENLVQVELLRLPNGPEEPMKLEARWE
ncbi:serine hydrolase domain-containing protein [Paenibacillus sp. UNC451MF]|uniref:serine hydrolase domain-containing protein n=1 Tax=Paenibacillus sp. UNC451MF TaxID=1449063 RepID=UPI0005678027|nr:serine hydrolase [Paenibacillus sp. UNC451MF]